MCLPLWNEGQARGRVVQVVGHVWHLEGGAGRQGEVTLHIWGCLRGEAAYGKALLCGREEILGNGGKDLT